MNIDFLNGVTSSGGVRLSLKYGYFETVIYFLYCILYLNRCIFALGMDLVRELEVAEDIAGFNPKNYQVW